MTGTAGCVCRRPPFLFHCTVVLAARAWRVTCPANLVLSLGLLWLLFQLTFDVGVVTIFGRRMAEHVKEELRRNYFTVERGYNSFPIPVVPWTRYSQAIKVRRRHFDLSS